jgi:regulator of sirC expression with transglutaminase-like and TPR domain
MATVVRSELIDRLRAIGGFADADIPLAEAAVLLAALDRPAVDVEPYEQHLRTLADDARRTVRASDGVERQAVTLADLLSGGYGYHGDALTYDDPSNANLIDVIDRRKGLPVALGILYLHAGRAGGADMVGLGFPSHFLVRLSARGQRVIIDPFHHGQQLDAAGLRQRLKELHGAEAEIAPEHYTPVGNRDVLIRLQNNIKMRAIAAGDTARAIEVLEGMALFAPDRGELSWELAILESRSGDLPRAIATLERFLTDRPGAAGRTELEDLLKRLRGRVK